MAGLEAKQGDTEKITWRRWHDAAAAAGCVWAIGVVGPTAVAAAAADGLVSGRRRCRRSMAAADEPAGACSTTAPAFNPHRSALCSCSGTRRDADSCETAHLLCTITWKSCNRLRYVAELMDLFLWQMEAGSGLQPPLPDEDMDVEAAPPQQQQPTPPGYAAVTAYGALWVLGTAAVVCRSTSALK